MNVFREEQTEQGKIKENIISVQGSSSDSLYAWTWGFRCSLVYFLLFFSLSRQVLRCGGLPCRKLLVLLFIPRSPSWNRGPILASSPPASPHQA